MLALLAFLAGLAAGAYLVDVDFSISLRDPARQMIERITGKAMTKPEGV